VSGEDMMTGEHWPTVQCFVTFVALDDNRRPTPVAPLLQETDEHRGAEAAAEERRRARLARR
jgi:acyl-CoA hydrolase